MGSKENNNSPVESNNISVLGIKSNISLKIFVIGATLGVIIGITYFIK